MTVYKQAKYAQPGFELTAPAPVEPDKYGSIEEYILRPKFRASLQQRKANFKWLCSEVSITCKVCHPLYNCFAPFVGYSNNLHLDTKDASPTILLNFGYTCLHLPDFIVVVVLQPGDKVFFNAASIRHFTTPMPGYLALWDKRWAVSCFFQTRVHQWAALTIYPQVALHQMVQNFIADNPQA